MSPLTSSPRLVKGGLVLVDPASGAVQRVIALQYNPDTLTRTLQVQGAGGDGRPVGGAAAQGAAVETIKLEAELDADRPARVPATRTPTRSSSASTRSSRRSRRSSIRRRPRCIVERRAGVGRDDRDRAGARRRSRCSSGAPSGSCRCGSPSFSVTEEAFDPALNPIRAKVSLGMRVLTVDDLGFAHRGGEPLHGLPASQGAARRPRRRRRAVQPRHRRDPVNEPLDQLEAHPRARRRRPRASRPPAATTPRPRRRCSTPTAGRSPTCAAASCRRRSASRRCASTSSRRATGSTTSPRGTSATPSCSGGSATPTARCAPTS